MTDSNGCWEVLERKKTEIRLECKFCKQVKVVRSKTWETLTKNCTCRDGSRLLKVGMKKGIARIVEEISPAKCIIECDICGARKQYNRSQWYAQEFKSCRCERERKKIESYKRLENPDTAHIWARIEEEGIDKFAERCAE